MSDDWQFRAFMEYEGTKEEYPMPMIVQNILKEHSHQTAPYNRDVRDTLTLKQKSDRLFQMMTAQPVQTMMRKKINYRTRGAFGPDRPEFFLFDGNHRMTLLRDFMNGKCYFRLLNKTDMCNYYAWASQEAVDSVDHESLGYSKEYTTVINHEFMSRLKTCPVSMIELNRNMSDIDAYQRARVVNECRPLQNSQLIKCMCALGTKMSDMLRDLSKVSGKICEFLRDDIYTCNGSILILAAGHAADTNFYNYIVKTKNLNKLDAELRSTRLDNDAKFWSTLLKVKSTTETKLNRALDTIDPPLKKTDNSHKSTVGLFYIALFLAELNVDSGAVKDEFVKDDKVLSMLEAYMKLTSHEKGENHKRLYHFFRTGVFPPLKRKRAREEDDDEF